MKRLKSISLGFIISNFFTVILSQSSPTEIKAYPILRMVSESQGDVMLYDDNLYTPIAHGLPPINVAPYGKDGLSEKCIPYESIEEANDYIHKMLISLIPSKVRIEKPTDDYIKMIRNNTLKTSQYYNKRLNNIRKKAVPLIKGLSKLELDNQNKYSRYNKSISRSKRFAPLIPLAAIGIIGLMTSGIVWNRVDISKLTNIQEELISNNQIISEDLMKIQDSANVLINETNNIYEIVSEHHQAINEIIDKINCMTYLTQNLEIEIENWKYLAVNSFIRAVQSALSGKVSPDLIPFSVVTKMLQHDERYKDLIYVNNPLLFYKLSVFDLVEIDRDPFLIMGTIITPRLFNKVLGQKVELYRCPIAMAANHNAYLSIENKYIVSSDNNDWWIYSTQSCMSSSDITICLKRSLGPRYDTCASAIFNNRSSNNCKLGQSNIYQSIPNVIVTEKGLLSCELGVKIELLSRDNIGSMRVIDVIEKTKGMIYIPQDRCDQIMISSKLYDMPRSHIIINTTLISIENIQHHEVINNLTHDLSITYISPLNLIPLNHITEKHNYIIMTALPLLILILICLIIVGFIKYKKQKGTVEKMWAYFHTKPYLEHLNSKSQASDV